MNMLEHKQSFEGRLDEEVLKASFAHPHLFEIIVSRYEAAFLRKAMHIVRHEEAAKDIVQDTFVRIYVYGRKFRPVEGATFSSWAYKILTNVCFLWYKKLKREREFFSIMDEEVAAAVPQDDSTEREQRLDRDYLESLFSRVSETFGRILRLYVMEGKDYRQIAEAEGTTEAAIKVRMHRARKELQEASKHI